MPKRKDLKFKNKALYIRKILMLAKSGASLRQIADIVGLSHTTINKDLVKYGFTAHKKNHNPHKRLPNIESIA